MSLGAGGQGWLQLEELGTALALSALVGLEREVRRKSAGLRTYTLIGVSSALFMLVSKYGFDDVLAPGRVVVDPSRVAAQIVSGIGFVGGGVIFMRRDVVRGLTTAASVWLAAALGMACGAGLLLLALATTLCHFLIMLGFPLLIRSLRRGARARGQARLRIRYEDARGLLGSILTGCTATGFAIDRIAVDRSGPDGSDPERLRDAADREGVSPATPRRGPVVLVLRVKGRRPVAGLIAHLAEIEGVASVADTEAGEEPE